MRLRWRTDEGEAAVTIRDAHTNIVRITENGQTVYEKRGTCEKWRRRQTGQARMRGSCL